MRSSLIAGLVLAAALILSALTSTAGAALPPGISGAWYNPAQPGHGLTVEMLPGARALVFWHVFDPAGDPVHLYIEGSVVGHSIQGDAFLGHGMRFGSFDRDQHVLTHWGQVTLRFDACDRAALAWTADGPGGEGYPSGSTALRRLSAIAGMECTLPPTGGLPAGSYQGTGDNVFGEYPVQAAVDLGGRLWALRSDPGWAPLDGLAAQFASLFLGQPTAPGSTRMAVEWLLPSAFMSPTLDWPAQPFILDFHQEGGAWRAEGATEDGHELALSQRAQGDPLRRPFDVAELAGARFEANFRTQFFDSSRTITFLADGTLCIGNALGDACQMHGRYLAEDPGLAMVSFTLVDQRMGFGRHVYSGKAWLLPAGPGQPQRLFMAGRGHGTGARTDAGLAVVGHRIP